MQFDSFYVVLGSLNDEVGIEAHVTVGFWDEARIRRSDVVVTVYLEPDLSASLRELRERAKDAALARFQEAARLLEQSSTDELHATAEQNVRDQEAERSASLEASMAAALNMGS